MRKPRGYEGKNHETIGSDILAVLKAVPLDPSFAAGFLGSETVMRVQAVDPNGWYPIGWLLEMMDLIEKKLGKAGLILMGRNLFKMSHEQRVKAVAKGARDIITGLDGMYHHANRGEGIGGWAVLKFERGHAEVEKTTPHHCTMEEGILLEALQCVGAPCLISQSQCFRQGAESCIYQINAMTLGKAWA
jgi:hypothetical protein